MPGIYRGDETMEAERAQSLWSLVQGQKRHGKKTKKKLGKRSIFGAVSNIFEEFLPPGFKQVADVASKQLEQKLFELPEYKDKGGFWGSKFAAEYKEMSDEDISGADTSLLEGIIGGVGDYVGEGGGFDISSLFGGGESMDYAGDFSPEFLAQFAPNGVSEESMDMAQGGRVPHMDQEQLMTLLSSILGQQEEQTEYNGTPNSLSEYFASKGKTLGGNNTQSLSQILGR